MSDLISLFEQNAGWPLVQKIVLSLNRAEEKAFLAGGGVRDALLGHVPKDFDIATSARPDKILSLFPNSNQQGKAFGVVVVFDHQGGPGVEVATFRKDGPYRDGRHPEHVEFLSDKEDALRRDFTINGLFYDLKTQKVIDYVGGLTDLRKKVIRSVGDPETRFQEDHLRILRALRFSLRFGFPIESNTKHSLFKMKGTLLNISKERVYEESLKILQLNNFAEALPAFHKLGLLQEFTGLSEEVYDWPFCQRFWSQAPPSALLQDKGELVTKGVLSQAPPSALLQDKVFLWARAFFPLVMPALFTESLPLLQENLKKWKFPSVVIRGIKNICYDSGFILSMKKASLGKKLRVWDSPLAGHVVFLCRVCLQSQELMKKPAGQPHKKPATTERASDAGRTRPLWWSGNPAQILKDMEKTELAFRARAVAGHLPRPLVTGYDLKGLGFAEDKTMAHKLEWLYDFQLEQKITDKEKLLKTALNLHVK